jgi:hypothetical protein
MSSTRILDRKFAWTEEQRAMELLDWEIKPEDFDRLCEHIIGLLCTRGWTREKLFALLPEDQLRRELRATAERFQERHVSLPMFILLRFHTSRLPELARQRKQRGEQ